MEPLEKSIHDTVHKDKTSCERIARTLGMSSQVLRNKACATNEHHKLAVVEAVAIMHLERDYSMLYAMCEELDIEKERVLRQEICASLGSVSALISKLLINASRKVDRKEVAVDVTEAIEALSDLLSRMGIYENQRN